MLNNIPIRIRNPKFLSQVYPIIFEELDGVPKRKFRISNAKEYCHLIVFFIILLFSGCKEKILHNLSENDANRVIYVLAKENLTATKVSDGANWLIEIEQENMIKALEIIEQNRMINQMLERAKRDTERVSNFIQTKEEIQRRIEERISSNLEDTLLRFPGVLEAKVHLTALSESRIDLRQAKDSKSASALLVVDIDYQSQDEQIKNLISGASGVTPDKISIIVANVRQNRNDNKITDISAMKDEKCQQSANFSILQCLNKFTDYSMREILTICSIFILFLFMIISRKYRRIPHSIEVLKPQQF